MPRPISRRKRRTLRHLLLIVPFAVLVIGGLIALRAYWGGEGESGGSGGEDLRVSIIQYRNHLQAHPNDVDARLQLGLIFVKAGDYGAAEKELTMARRLGASREAWIPGLAESYRYIGKHEALLDELQVELSDPASLQAETLALRAFSLLQLERREEAEQALEDALVLDENSASARVGLAQLAMVRGDLEEANRLLEEATALAPEHSEAWQESGRLAMLQGDMARAQSAFSRVINLRPGRLAARLGLAEVHLAEGNIEKAAKFIGQLRQLSPNHPGVLFLNARLKLAERKFDEAEDVLNALISNYKHIPSHLLLGRISFDRGNLAQAREHLELFHQVYPKHLEAGKTLAATYIRQREQALALKTLEAVGFRESEDPSMLALAGSALFANGKVQEGLTFLGRAADLAPDSFEVRAQLALGHLLEGKPDSAVSELDEVREGSDPRRTSFLLIYTHLLMKDLEKALAEARLVAERFPEDPQVFNVLGSVLGMNNKLGEARHAFQRTLELDSEQHNAEINLARIDISDGDFERASKRFRKVLDATRWQESSAAVGLAEILFKQDKADAARDTLLRAWDSNKKSIALGTSLVRALSNNGDNLRALSVARELYELYPDQPVVLQLLGSARIANRESANAIEPLAELTRRTPKSARAWRLLARAQALSREYDDALVSVDRALLLDDSDSDSVLLKSVILIAKKQWAQADILVKRFKTENPKDFRGFSMEAGLWLARGDHERATDALKRALELTPNNSDIALQIADIFQQKRDLAGEIDWLEEWLGKNPRDHQVRKRLAMSYQQANRSEAAKALYERLIGDDQKDTVILNNLAWLYHQLDDPRALSYAREAAELAPNSPDILDTLGWIQINQGDVEFGLSNLKQALALAPNRRDIRYHLAVGYTKHNLPRRAQSELEQLLANDQPFPERADAEALLKGVRGQ